MDPLTPRMYELYQLFPQLQVCAKQVGVYMNGKATTSVGRNSVQGQEVWQLAYHTPVTCLASYNWPWPAMATGGVQGKWVSVTYRWSLARRVWDVHTKDWSQEHPTSKWISLLLYFHNKIKEYALCWLTIAKINKYSHICWIKCLSKLQMWI